MFLHPLGLLALLAVPAVVALHLFRRRFRRHVVSAVFLWAREDRTSAAGRRREPLRKSPSFWCELAAAVLLGLAFGGPRACGAGSAEHLVCVLDASASMGAHCEGSAGPTFAQLAGERIDRRIARLGRGARVTLIASGARPEVLAGPAAFPREARAALARHDPTQPQHDPTAALALAAELAGDGSVLFVSDRFEPESLPESVELVSVGRPVANVAITSATRRRAPGDEELVTLGLTSHAFAPRPVRLELRAAGTTLAARELELVPGRLELVSVRIPATELVLEARLDADALALDDVAWLAPPPPRTLALASTLEPAVARRIGLRSPGSADDAIDRWLDLVPDAVQSGVAGAHLVLGEETAAPSPGNAATWSFTFDAPGDERMHLVGPFLADRKHPLLEGTTLEGIVWSASAGDGSALAGGTPLVSAGDRPLLCESRSGARRSFRADLDPRTSTLFRSPDWPILLANLAELRRAELPGPTRTSLALGEAFLYRASEDRSYVWRGPLAHGRASTERTIPARGTLVVEGVTRPGVYELARADDPDASPLCRVAYSFVDGGESDLTGLGAGTRPAAGRSALLRAGFTWLESLLVVLALVLLLLDWRVLAPKA